MISRGTETTYVGQNLGYALRVAYIIAIIVYPKQVMTSSARRVAVNAARSEDAAELRKLLKSCWLLGIVNVNHKDDAGNTPLHYAVGRVDYTISTGHSVSSTI